MTHPTAEAGKFYLDKLNKLKGYVLLQASQDEEGFLCLEFSLGGDKAYLWLLSDDEGNAPASFELQLKEQPND